MRSAHRSALLARYGIEPCEDIAARMLRNEFVDLHDRIVIARAAEGLAAIIRELDQQPEQIAAWLERCGCPAIADDVRAGRWKELG